jgi:hypothetical protein
MKIGFFTHISDHLFDSFGTQKLINSLKYFHPEIPLHVFGTKELDEEFQRDPWQNWFTINPVMALRLVDSYDMLVHFDADSMVTGRLYELLQGDFEVAGVRNNCDRGTAGCFSTPAKVLKKINGELIEVFKVHPHQYVNAGLVASTSKKFWKDWVFYNRMFNAKEYNSGEQDILNLLFHSSNYKTKIIDAIETEVYYGISNSYGTNHHWESWKEIVLSENRLFLNGKQIKILHHAGGHGAIPKLNFDLFTPEVSEFLTKITGLH